MALLDLGVCPFISARYCFFQRVTADGPAPEIAPRNCANYSNFLAAVITIRRIQPISATLTFKK
jgi:hypothetical protein